MFALRPSHSGPHPLRFTVPHLPLTFFVCRGYFFLLFFSSFFPPFILSSSSSSFCPPTTTHLSSFCYRTLHSTPLYSIPTPLHSTPLHSLYSHSPPLSSPLLPSPLLSSTSRHLHQSHPSLLLLHSILLDKLFAADTLFNYIPPLLLGPVRQFYSSLLFFLFACFTASPLLIILFLPSPPPNCTSVLVLVHTLRSTQRQSLLISS